jgi:Dolichyl-phosphate-mannose-protein mannosyltransferase
VLWSSRVGERLGERRALLALSLLGLGLRVAFLLLEPTTSPVADERTWTNWAIENLVTPKVSFSPLRTHMLFYPPLYPYFIAAGYTLLGGLAAVKWAQLAVSTLLIPAVGRVGRAAFGAPAGLCAAALTAAYPDFVWYSVHFWSETLFLVLLFWGFERVLAADAGSSRGVALWAGVLFGLAVLTRETALYFAPLVALWLARRRGRGDALRGAAFLLATLLSVAPWTLRNWIVFKAFVPVSTAGGLNLWQGNARLTRQEVYDRYYAVHGRIEEYRNARRMGLQAILERQPTWIFEKLRDEMPLFWEADSLALVHIKRGAYGDVGAGWARAAWAAVELPYLAALALFALGLARLRLGPQALLLLVFLVYYNLLHVATHGFARYRLPVMPVVLVVAAAALVAWRTRRLEPWTAGRRLAVVALAVALVASVAPSLRANYESPAFGFSPPSASDEPAAP